MHIRVSPPQSNPKSIPIRTSPSYRIKKPLTRPRDDDDVAVRFSDDFIDLITTTRAPQELHQNTPTCACRWICSPAAAASVCPPRPVRHAATKIVTNDRITYTTRPRPRGRRSISDKMYATSACKMCQIEAQRVARTCRGSSDQLRGAAATG